MSLCWLPFHKSCEIPSDLLQFSLAPSSGTLQVCGLRSLVSNSHHCPSSQRVQVQGTIEASIRGGPRITVSFSTEPSSADCGQVILPSLVGAVCRPQPPTLTGTLKAIVYHSESDDHYKTYTLAGTLPPITCQSLVTLTVDVSNGSSSSTLLQDATVVIPDNSGNIQFNSSSGSITITGPGVYQGLLTLFFQFPLSRPANFPTIIIPSVDNIPSNPESIHQDLLIPTITMVTQLIEINDYSTQVSMSVDVKTSKTFTLTIQNVPAGVTVRSNFIITRVTP